MRLAMPHNAPASLLVHGVMHRIKTYNAISSKGLDRFDRELYEVGQDIANPDASPVVVGDVIIKIMPLGNTIKLVFRQHTRQACTKLEPREVGNVITHCITTL